ncbi:MAG: DUF177 domain-containing protein [Vicinamibacteraceae bacterium]
MSDRSNLPTQIDLRSLGEAELHVDRTFSPQQVMGQVGGGGARPDSGTGTAADDEFSVLGPVTFKGTLARSGDRFQLKGRVAATLQLNCGRCLTPFPLPVNTTVDLSYIPERPPVTAVKEPAKGSAKDSAKGSKAPAIEEEVELQDEDLDTAYYRDHVLDLADMLREQFYLTLPMRPLCRPDCQGLCPSCGIDRNVDTCQCTTDWVDPRLSGLKALVTRKTD